MKKTQLLLPTVCTFALGFSGTAAGQASTIGNGTDRGFVHTFPAGLILSSDSTDPMDPTTIDAKPVGDQTTPPLPWNSGAPDAPDDTTDFSQTSASGLFTAYPNIKIDAHSTGASLIPRHGDENGNLPGILDIGQNSWAALSISLSGDSIGKASSRFRESLTQYGNANADIVTYYFPAGTSLPGAYDNKTLMEMDRGNLGMDGATMIDREIEAFDYGMGLTGYQHGQNTSGFGTPGDYYYFSVTAAWAQQNSGLLFAVPYASSVNQLDTTASLAPSGATVYRMRRETGAWTLPEAFITYQDLKMESTAELDALDYSNSSKVLIFSIKNGTVFNGQIGGSANFKGSQLMIYQFTQDPGDDIAINPAVLKVNEGTRVTKKFDIKDVNHSDPDDVGSLCTIDPESNQTDHVVATPVYSANDPAKPMHLSMTRRIFGSGGTQGEYVISCAGWGPFFNGFNSTAKLYSKAENSSTWVLESTNIRTPNDDEVLFTLPASYTDVIHEFRVLLEETGSSTQRTAESHTTRIVL